MQMEKGLQVKESEWQLEAEKDKDMGSFLEFPEGNNPVNTLTLCRAQSLQLCPTLCDPMDHSLPGSSVHGILQARILGWVATPRPPPGDLPDLRIEPEALTSLALAGTFFTTGTTWEAQVHLLTSFYLNYLFRDPILRSSG